MRLRHAATRSSVNDPKEFGRVAVLSGGDGAERDASLESGAAVLAALQRRGVDAHGIDPAERSLADLPVVFDRAFIALHGRGGEDGAVQGALECLGLPYTGSGVLGSALGMDKLRTKRMAQAIGIATADYIVIRGPADIQVALDRIGLPLVFKPASQGSGVGQTCVADVAALPAAFQVAAEVDDCVFAEQWLPGAEFSVGILQGEVLAVLRVDEAGGPAPSGLSGPAESHVRELALATFEAVGAEGWACVEFRSDATGRPHLLEINTVPGMTGRSRVPLAARAAGIDFDTLCWRVLETSFTRVPKEPALEAH